MVRVDLFRCGMESLEYPLLIVVSFYESHEVS